MKTIILIHGAWQGSWAFDAWRPWLIASGWHVVAVDLPGNGWNAERLKPDGLAHYTAHVAQILAEQPGPCVVLGHSGGGLVASQVAELLPDRVAALVYLVGMMLPSGMSFKDLVAAQRALVAGKRALVAGKPDDDFGGIVPHLEFTDGGAATRVPVQAALDVFLHDCPPIAATIAAHKLRPQLEAGRAVANTLTPERFGRVPRVYVEALQDRSIDIRLQRAMQALTPGAAVVTCDCGHVPQLAMPGPLTELVCKTLARVVSQP